MNVELPNQSGFQQNANINFIFYQILVDFSEVGTDHLGYSVLFTEERCGLGFVVFNAPEGVSSKFCAQRL